MPYRISLFSVLFVTTGLLACSAEASAPSAPAPDASSTAEPATPAAATHQVIVTNFAYEPKTLTIRAGDTVEWIWREGTHSVVSGKVCRPDNVVRSGSHTAPFTFRRTFDTPGTTEYFCDVRDHCSKGQVGTIVVE